jgi:hypothetical protein
MRFTITLISSKHNNIRTPVVLALDDRVLVHHQPVVRRNRLKIHQEHMVIRDGAVGPRVFHLDPIAKQLVESAVGLVG